MSGGGWTPVQSAVFMCFMNAHKLVSVPSGFIWWKEGRKGRKEIGRKKGRREGDRCK